jgi:hypothetical protein
MNKGDPTKAEDEHYQKDLEAMAELLLDMYLDKNLSSRENDSAVLTRPSRGRKIILLPGAETRRVKRSPNQ